MTAGAPGPLIATKLYVPKLRSGSVRRPRLLERLQRSAAARLVLVSAPAGFGKTTLLAEWLDAGSVSGRSVAWLALDRTDNQPAAFWTYVTAALQGVVSAVDQPALEIPAAGPGEATLTTLLNQLTEAPGETWLVLDDYHLIDDPAIGRGMAFLLEHLPPQVHVALSTRADPDLPLARWRVRGELVEVRAADLRFTVDEAAGYLNGAAGLGLSAVDVEVLEERTEGWIAALQLAALSIQGRTDVSELIARFAGTDRYLLDYLVEEVLAQQPEAVRDFLLETSVLERLTGPLCDAVTGRDVGAAMLVRLERANLFLVALDDHREWYRYHHLFADVLRARLLAEQPDRVPVLHQRASGWFERHDLAEEAVRHALAAKDVDRAVHLIELAVSMIRRHRREAMMYGWLRALPDDAIRRSPVLSVFYGSMLLAAGDADAVEPRLTDAERALAAVPEGAALPWADTDDLHMLPATIAIYRASLAQARGDATGTAAYARRALELAGPDDHFARGGAAGFLGLAAWAMGDVTNALATFTQAVASLRAAGSLVDELSGTNILADLWLAAGRPSTARRLIGDALQTAAEHGELAARASAELHVGLSELDVEIGDLSSASEHLQAAVGPGERAGMNEGRYRWFVASGLLARAEGDLTASLRHLEQAQMFYRPGFYPDVRPIGAMKARLWIAQGKLSAAVDWAHQRGVTAADEPRYLREFDHLTLVRLLIAQDRAHPTDANDATGQALHLLGRLASAAEAAGRAGSLLEIRLLQALAHDAVGDRPGAMELLAAGWALAPEPDAYGRLFLDEDAPMITLLRDAQHQGVGQHHPGRLLALSGARDVDPPDVNPALPDPLSARELQVLRLLDSELSGPEIARTLFVSHNTLRTHTKHIFAKLDVTSRRAAVRRARERGLL